MQLAGTPAIKSIVPRCVVKRGDLRRAEFDKKALFHATDLAAFPAKLSRLSVRGASDAPNASKATEQS